MKIKAFLLSLLAILLCPAALHAQATRTWVSGVGDDANPCSRTAPGKTFAGAIGKTAVGGEIDALDPAGFGAVTITKSITIDGGGGQVASILVSGTNGLNINAGDTDVIVLRNIRFEGLGTGLSGINIFRAGAVHIQNCTFNGFNTAITFASTSATAKLFVNGCRIHKCTVAGVSLASGADSQSTLEDTSVEGCADGFTLSLGTATLSKCTSSGNTATGFSAAAGTKMTLSGCTSSGNGVGVHSDGIVYLSDSIVTNNLGAGLQRTGSIFSFRDNRVVGNNPDGKPNKTLIRR